LRFLPRLTLTIGLEAGPDCAPPGPSNKQQMKWPQVRRWPHPRRRRLPHLPRPTEPRPEARPTGEL